MKTITKKRYVVAKCIGCGAKKKIYPGEIAVNDMPICNRCFNPMVAIKAVKGD